MKMDKKDIPKILLLIGIFVIALGLFFNFYKKDEKQKKIEWKDSVLEENEENNIEEPTIEDEIIVDGEMVDEA